MLKIKQLKRSCIQGRNSLLFILDAQTPIKIFLTPLNYLCKFSAYLEYVSDNMVNLALLTVCHTAAPEDTNIILCPHFKQAPLLEKILSLEGQFLQILAALSRF